MKVIKITVDAPMLPNIAGIKHTATSYQIGLDKDLTKPENILTESLKDNVNLRTWIVNLDVEQDTVLFIRAKYHFIINGTERESNWSRTMPVGMSQTGIKISGSMVKTPLVETNINEDNLLEISTSDLAMWNGVPEHKATSYRLTDSDNIIIWDRRVDEDNLIKIEVDNVFKPGKLYVAQASHMNVTNNESNYGKIIYLNSIFEKELFSFEAPEAFVINRKFYYRLKIYTPRYQSYNLEIRDNDGQVVYKLDNEMKTTNKILLDMLQVNKKYSIYVKINFTDGNSSMFYNVYEATLIDNIVIPYIPNTPYREKYHNTGELNTNGMNCVTLRETYDGKIIAPDYNTNMLHLYKNVDNRLVKMKTLFEFENDLEIDYINIVQLPNHDILIDVIGYDDRRQLCSKFITFEWDPIKLELTKLKELIREDERYSTSVSNSLLVMNNGEVYYIPACIIKDESDVREALTLRKLDTANLTIVEEYPLPYMARYYVSLFKSKDENIYIYGGSITNRHYNKNGEKIEYWELDNRDMFEFNRDTKKFLLSNSMTNLVPNTLYNTQPFLRLDGKIVFVNACVSGDGLRYQDIVTFDPPSRTYNVTPGNTKVEIPFRTSIYLNNGNIIRISSLPEDPQYSRTYISNTMASDTIVDIDQVVTETQDLDVADGEIVNIEDIYKYKNITIHGTGLLKWFRPQGITVIDSKTLIVNTNMYTTNEALENAAWEKILVLDGYTFQIINK